MGQNWVAGAVPFFLEELGPTEHKVAWAEAYTIPSGILVHSRFTTTDIGRKLGGAVPV